MPSLVKYSTGKLSRLSKNCEIRKSFPPRLFCRIRYFIVKNTKTYGQCTCILHKVLCSSSISWVSFHFDGRSSSISWISVHCNVTTIWILFSVNILIIIHFNLFLEPVLVIQAGNNDTDQCSNNKCDNKCDHYTDSNCCSYRELII